MSEKPLTSNEVEYELLDATPIGSNTVVFRISDGSSVKVRVDIERAAVAVNFKNPDGTPYYTFNFGNHVTVIHKNRRFRGPKPVQPGPSPNLSKSVM